ncbi:MAG TPA: GNAT family N-acetyltransferase [Gemmatimonadales bacterium]|nr:GNAT family N-acetyltransferase [Gemmatimonadales bacterium]
MALLPDRRLVGPERPTLRDIEPLNRIFSDAFTDRYRRDGLAGVRVPHLNPLVWRYAIEDAGDGAMIWRDADGQPIGFNMVHRSGAEGWMGPLAVRPDRQGDGVGKRMVQAGIDWLQASGVATIGLETMPRTPDNIGFYSRLGFTPRHLTITLVRDLPRRAGIPGEPLGGSGASFDARVGDCRALTQRLARGVDFTRELVLTRDLQLGDTTLVWNGSRLRGFALWHSVPLAEGRVRDELRVLKLVAEDFDAFTLVVRAVEGAAIGAGIRRVAIRCQTAYPDAYARLVEDGYRVHWTDLRMTLHGYDEIRPTTGVVFSNWEI